MTDSRLYASSHAAERVACCLFSRPALSRLPYLEARRLRVGDVVESSWAFDMVRAHEGGTCTFP